MMLYISPPSEHPDASTADEKRGGTEVRKGQGFSNNNNNTLNLL